MKNKNQHNSKQVLLKLLREKQAKEAVGYITTNSTSYKILRWIFFAAVLYCTFINLSYLIGKFGEMSANIANMGEIEPHQQLEIDRLFTTLNIVFVSAVGIVLSEIFVWFKLPVLQIVFSVIPSITIVVRLANEINDKTSNTLFKNHILPLAVLCICGSIAAILHLRQLYFDKKGCQAISEIIYKKYGAVAKDISPDEWNNVLAEYTLEKCESKKRSVKTRKNKQNTEIINDKNTTEE